MRKSRSAHHLDHKYIFRIHKRLNHQPSTLVRQAKIHAEKNNNPHALPSNTHHLDARLEPILDRRQPDTQAAHNEKRNVEHPYQYRNDGKTNKPLECKAITQTTIRRATAILPISFSNVQTDSSPIFALHLEFHLPLLRHHHSSTDEHANPFYNPDRRSRNAQRL